MTERARRFSPRFEGGNMKESRKARWATRFALWTFAFGSLGSHGATCEQDQGPDSYGSGPTKTLRGFGNSIGAGYAGANPFPRQRDSYFNYYGQAMAADRGWQVEYHGIFDSGEHTGPQQSGDLGIGSSGSIYAHMLSTSSYVRNADVLTIEAGGNDFLYSRSQFRSNCDQGLLDERLDRWKQDWDLVLGYISANRNTYGLTVGMSIYYPNPDDDGRNGSGPTCNGTSLYEVLLPRLLSAADYTCSTLEAAGFKCVDSFAVMNCDADAHGNPDFDCPNKRTLQDLESSGTCPRLPPLPGAVYTWPAMDPDCIAAHIHPSALKDPRSLHKAGNIVNYIQSDGTHPNDAGHVALGNAHLDLGFHDYLGSNNSGPFPEDTYQGCIDGLDNDGDGDFDCSDSDCSPYCS